MKRLELKDHHTEKEGVKTLLFKALLFYSNLLQCLKRYKLARKRRFSVAGFYHVINRGVEKRDVFLDKEDYKRFLEICDEYSKIFNFTIQYTLFV